LAQIVYFESKSEKKIRRKTMRKAVLEDSSKTVHLHRQLTLCFSNVTSQGDDLENFS